MLVTIYYRKKKAVGEENNQRLLSAAEQLSFRLKQVVQPNVQPC
jgi:hypothetical protein